MIFYITESVNTNIYYHLSSNKFDKFDINKAGVEKSSTVHGYGLYFSSNPKNLEVYGFSNSYLYQVEIVPSVLKGLVNYNEVIDSPSDFFDELSEIYEDEDELREVLGLEGSDYEGDYPTYESIYDWITDTLGSKSKASKFMLENMSITGFHYRSMENKEGTNIVLFSDYGIKINKIKKVGK
jgi:hypothetical protein